MRAVAGGLLRLVHPFPSALDAAVTLVLARIAGASLDRAALLALSMLAIQFSIGAANNVVDAPADAIAGRGKPLVDATVPARLAVAVAATLGPVGVALAVVAGPAPALVAVVGYGIGLIYDLRLKATAWSWLPFAAGLPLLPVFAWVGATGRLPAALLVLAGLGGLAGAGLAIANSLADEARDTASRTRTVARSLGRPRALRVEAVLDLVVIAVALGSSISLAGSIPGTWLALVGAATLGLGVAIGFAGHLQRAWEVQAVGLATLAAGWVAALAAVGRL